MTMRKLIATGLVAVIAVLVVAADAHALGKRKRNRGGCDDCGYAAPVYTGGGCSSCGGYAAGWSGGYAVAAGGCGDCGAGGYAVAPGGYAVGQAPEAMPAPGTAAAVGGTATTQPETVTPAQGTNGATAVTPAGGTAVQGTVVQPGVVAQPTYVVPAGGYYQGGSYVYPAGGYYSNGGYVTPAGGYYQGGYNNFQSGFGSGVIQGAFGTPSYVPYGSSVQGAVGNYVGGQVGRGLFRR
jgi:hypothetical protein